MADDGVQDQLYQLTTQINRLVKLFGGGGQSPFSDPGTSKPKLRGGIFDRDKDHTEKRSALGAGISSIQKVVTTMHGGADEFVYSLTNASKGLGVAAVALTALFEGAMKLTRTYNKMSDIGQTYGGSMLTMAAEAGRAGLTLNQFAELQSRNSTVTAMMSDTLERNIKVQQVGVETTQTMSGAQTIVSRNLLDASASIDRFVGGATAAAGATGDLGAQHSDTGTAASLLQTVLMGATSSAADLTHQQIAMGNSMAQAQAQITALGQTQTTPDTAQSLVAALGEAGRVAGEMAVRQASMGDTIGTLNDRLTATSSVTSSVSGSMGALLSAQTKTSELTTTYNKQVAEAAASATQYAVAQGAAGGASDRARSDLDRRIQAATETFSSLTDQQKRVSDLTATIDRGLTSAAGAVLTPRTAQTQTSQTALAATTGAVTRSQALLGSAVTATTGQLNTLTGNLNQQTETTTRTGGAFTMMGNVAVETGRNLDSVASSTDQVTQANTRQAAASAQIAGQAQKDGKGTTQTLAQLQLAVRDDLTQFGFFGMSLGELTNATSDYMQTMLMNGQLNRMDGDARRKGVEQMLATASELSQVWGTSREAILKNTNAAMQQSNFAAAMIDSDQRRVAAGAQWIEALSAIPGEMGPKLSQMFAEQVGKGGFINTAMGKGFISTGMGELNEILVGRAQRAMNSNQAVTPGMQADAMGDAYNALRANRDRLEQLSNDPELGPAAQEQLKLLTSLSSKYTKVENGMTVFNKKAYADAMAQAALDKGHQDVVTKNMMVFSSSIEKVTGGFMDGFYSMIAEMVGNDDPAIFQQTLNTLQNTFKKLGSAVGTLVGIMFSPTAIDIASVLFKMFEGLATIVGKVVDVLNWMMKEIIDIVNGFRTYVSKIPGLGWMAPAKQDVDKDGKPISKEAALTAKYQKLSLNEAELQRESQYASSPETQAAAKKDLADLADIRNTMGMKNKGESLNADEYFAKKDRAESKTPMGIGTAAMWGAVPAYLAYSHVLNRGATRAANNQGGLLDRMMRIMPGGRSRLGRATAALEKSKAGQVLGAVTGMGDGCCDKISNGLGGLADKIDLHGEKAEKSAAKIAEATVESGEKVAESALKGGAKAAGGAATVAETAIKGGAEAVGATAKTAVQEGSLAFRAGHRTASIASSLYHAPGAAWHGIQSLTRLARSGLSAGLGMARTGVSTLRSGASSILSRGAGAARTGLSAVRSGAGGIFKTMKGSLAGIGEGVASVATKGLSKSLLKVIPGVGLAMGGVFAAQRAMQGDFLGAAGELIGGVAGLVPGIGTAVDATIQAGLFARDMYNANQADADKKDTDPTKPDTQPVDPFADTGARNKDDPGINQSPAEANRDKIETLAEELGNKVQADKAAKDVKAEQTDQSQLNALLEILTVLGRNNKDMKANAEATQLIQSLWPLQISN